MLPTTLKQLQYSNSLKVRTSKEKMQQNQQQQNHRKRTLSQSQSTITQQQQHLLQQLKSYHFSYKNNDNIKLFLRPSSEMQKREQLSAKLLQSTTSSVNLSQQNELNRLNSYRNRSAFTDNNGGITKNQLIEMPQQPQQTQQFPQATAHANGKVIQDSNRFLEEILAYKRKNSDTTSINYNNLSSNNQPYTSTVQTLVLPGANGGRTSEEKALYPDKLILDRRNLLFCPVLEGEEQLKLINFQHNQIQKIQNLDSLRNLIFLDFYDNKLEKISGLSSLINLRVLMLGKNKISRIENLEELIYLDVLDLHGNEISKVENLNHLHELRVLNLAANKIRIVENLHGLHSLVEFNLRRNQIIEAHDLVHCVKLQRLFLSFNDITSLDAVRDISLMSNLQELALDGNPICNDKNYKKMVLSKIISLKQLDMKKITDDEKRNAIVLYQREEEKKREFEKNATNKEKRHQTLRNVQKMWSEQQSSTETYSARSSIVLSPINKREPDDGTSNNTFESNSTISFGKSGNRPASSQSDYKTNNNQHHRSKSSQRSDSVQSGNITVTEDAPPFNPTQKMNLNASQKPASGTNGNRRIISTNSDGSHLVEIEAEATLYFYGHKSLEEIDTQLGNNITLSVTTVSFSYVDFNHIAKYIIKIRNKFPNLSSLIFTCCNFQKLSQINNLSDLKKLDNLTINKEDNPIASISIWKYYAIYRLSHLQLKKIDDKQLTADDMVTADKLFAPLGNLTLQLPEGRLVGNLGQHRKKQIKLAKDVPNLGSADYITAKDTLIKSFITNYSNTKPKLQNNEYDVKRSVIKHFIEEIFSNTNYNDLKKQKLKQLQSQLWNQFIQTNATECQNQNDYVNKLCKKHGIVL